MKPSLLCLATLPPKIYQLGDPKFNLIRPQPRIAASVATIPRKPTPAPVLPAPPAPHSWRRGIPTGRSRPSR